MKRYHIPVLTKEVVGFLNCRSDGIYIDSTLGGGGWAEAILDASKPGGKLIGFDRDRHAIAESVERLSRFLERFVAIKGRFSALGSKLRELKISLVDGIVADLGVSSYQLDMADRGFGFSRPARLDMRMDEDQKLSAYEIINSSPEKQLADWFFEFGEERYSRRIAKAVVSERRKKRIETTSELAEIIARLVPGKIGRIHPATRVFQALRIVVNDEINELKSLVEVMPTFLNPGGRLVIASYHSLEDRIVKRAFIKLAADRGFNIVTKKPVRPSEEEVFDNRRARSARLRVLERA